MLDYSDPNKVWAEVEEHEKFRDEHVQWWARSVSRYHGTAYRSVAEPSSLEDWRDAFYHKYISLLLPRCAGRPTRVACDTTMPEYFTETARGIEHALNRWTEMSNAHAGALAICTDYLLMWGVAMRQTEVVAGAETDDPRAWPHRIRIEPNAYFCDSTVASRELGAIEGHRWIHSKDEVVATAEEEGEESGWDVAAVKSMPEASPEDLQKFGRHQSVRVDRGEVIFYDLWFPRCRVHEDEPEYADLRPGIDYNGSVMTLGWAPSVGHQIVRKLRPQMGGRTGPYTLYGCYRVPGYPYPLSPLVAVEGALSQLNAHKRAMQDAARKYKRSLIVGGPDSTLAQNIEKKPDWSVYWAGATFDKNRMEAVEVGGVSDQQLVMVDRMEQEAERASGLIEAWQGSTAGDTATEVSAAVEAGSVRMGLIAQQFMAGEEQFYRGLARELLVDDRIIVPLGRDVATPDMPSPGWQAEVDGPEADAIQEIQDPLDAVQVSVKPYSTEPVTQAQRVRNADTALQIVMEIGQIAPQLALSGVNLYELLRQVGEARGMEWLPDIWNYEQLAKAAQDAQVAAQAEASKQAAGAKLVRGVMGVPAMGGGPSRFSGGSKPAKPKAPTSVGSGASKPSGGSSSAYGAKPAKAPTKAGAA